MRKFLLLLLIPISCSNDLDKKQSRVRQDFGQTADIFAQLAEQRENAIGTFADKSFEQSKGIILKEWSEFIARHTDENGGLVSKDATGKVIPMPVVQLLEAMTKRSDKLMELAMSQKDWKEKQDSYRSAIGKFRATIAVLSKQEVDVQEAKESAQAALNQVISALGSIAATTAIMAPLAF